LAQEKGSASECVTELRWADGLELVSGRRLGRWRAKKRGDESDPTREGRWESLGRRSSDSVSVLGWHRYPSIRRWPQTPPSAAVPFVRCAREQRWVEFLAWQSRALNLHSARRGRARRMQLAPNRLLVVCIPWHAEPEFALVWHSARRGMARRMQLAPRRLLAVCIPWHAGPEF